MAFLAEIRRYTKKNGPAGISGADELFPIQSWINRVFIH
jgi:hypothetical protein